MSKILFIISLTTILLFNNNEIDYYVYSLFEKPDYQFFNDSDKNCWDDSLKILDGQMYQLIKNKADASKIYNILKREKRLLGIAIYTYQENNKSLVESIRLEYLGDNESFSLWLSYPTMIEFDRIKNYIQFSDQEKVEYILNFMDIYSDYYCVFGRIVRHGFPIPVPDASEDENEK